MSLSHSFLFVVGMLVVPKMGSGQGKGSSVAWEVQGNLKVAKSCFYNGTTIIDVVTPSDQCGKMCTDNFECTHFFWDSKKGGICTLKSGQGEWMNQNLIATTVADMICGIVTARDGVIDWKVGDNGKHLFADRCDFTTNVNDLSHTQSNEGDCGNFKCADQSACTHFTWTLVNGGTCWMKNGTDDWKAKAFKTDYNSTCGFKSDS